MNAPTKMTARETGEVDGIRWATCNAPFPPAVNGYALLPAGHPWRELDLQGEDYAAVDVHGGITYGPDADGWIGFDYLHAGDCWPGSRMPRFGDHVERTPGEVADEARSLARQIAARLVTTTDTLVTAGGWDPSAA